MRVILWLLILNLGACAPMKRTEERSLVPFSLREFIKEQEERERALSSVEGKLRVRYSVKRGSLAGAAKLIKYQDRSRFEVSDPMGRVRYWFVGDHKELLVFHETDKVAVSSGDGGKKYFQRFYGLKFSWQELESLWMGILPEAWRKNVSERWDYQSGTYRGVIKLDQHLSIFFEVMDKNYQLSRIWFQQENSKIQVTFDDFDACCAREKVESLLGHSVEINLADPSDKIEIEWEELKILEQSPNPDIFSKKLPRGSKLVNLEKEK